MRKTYYAEVGIIFLTITILGGMSSILAAEKDMHSSHHAGTAASHENPLVEEMMILDDVFKEVVSAVALADGERVHEALKSMHGTMEKTHKGVHEGKIRIPKNAQREKEFVAMDKAFHDDLKRLAEAGSKNDQGKMLLLTKKLLDGCVNCHSTFRE